MRCNRPNYERIRLAYLYYENSRQLLPRLAARPTSPRYSPTYLDVWREAKEAEEAEKVGASEAKAKAKAIENKAFDDEKAAWVKRQGSERLKVAVARGYKANRTYALERAAAEFPEFWVDTADELEWNDRPDPSETALDMEIKIREHLEELGQDEHTDARVVWLTEAPAAVDDKLDETGEQFEAQEAIVISPYLSRYALAMPVDPDQQVKVETSE